MSPPRDGGEGAHIIDIYTPRVRYIVRGNKAFEWTKKGRRRVTVEYAQHQVNRWKEREAKTLTSTPPTRRQMWYFLLAGVAFTVAIVAAFLLALGW